MSESLLYFILSSCFISIFFSIWIAIYLSHNDIARAIAFRVSIKFNKKYKAYEKLCVNHANTIKIYICWIILIAIDYFTYRDHGLFYALLLPMIVLTAVYIFTRFLSTKTFTKSRVDALLEFLLNKEIEFKQHANPQIEDIQLLCNYIIEEYKYEVGKAETEDANVSVVKLEGFDKAKRHVSNLGKELSSGMIILLIVIASALFSKGLMYLMNEDKRKENKKSSDLLNEARRLSEERKKSQQELK